MITRPRRIRTKLEANKRAYGAIVQLPSPDLVELVGHAGYDYVWIDAEHGSLGLTDLREMIRAADAVGIDSIIRLVDHQASFIQQVLDLGATGIVVPHMRTVEEAQRIVAAAHYAPRGSRGACPLVRSAGHVSQDWENDSQRANNDVLTFGLIEDVEALDNIEAIAEQGGLDGLVFGPFDLGQAMGYAADVTNSEIRALHSRVVEACRTAGIEYFTASHTWEFDAIHTNGSRIITVAGDRSTVLNHWTTSLHETMSELDDTDAKELSLTAGPF